MTIKFKSNMDIFRLTNALIFAQHRQSDIEEMRAFDHARAEQMEAENAEWFAMRNKLAKTNPGDEVEL